MKAKTKMMKMKTKIKQQQQSSRGAANQHTEEDTKTQTHKKFCLPCLLVCLSTSVVFAATQHIGGRALWSWEKKFSKIGQSGV